MQYSCIVLCSTRSSKSVKLRSMASTPFCGVVQCINSLRDGYCGVCRPRNSKRKHQTATVEADITVVVVQRIVPTTTPAFGHNHSQILLLKLVFYTVHAIS